MNQKQEKKPNLRLGRPRKTYRHQFSLQIYLEASPYKIDQKKSWTVDVGHGAII